MDSANHPHTEFAEYGPEGPRIDVALSPKQS